jgi:hypothetical protein
LPTVAAPSFPLSDEEFRRALRTGHGRARLHVLRHGVGDASAALVDACLSTWVFDPQIHGSRGAWLVEMVQAVGIANQVVEAISEANATQAVIEFWDADHRCSVLEAIARISDRSGARPVLYQMLTRVPESSDIVGLEQVVRLDGVDGVLRVARLQGKWLADDSSFCANDDPIILLADGIGEGRALAALSVAAESDGDVARYLHAIRDESVPDRGHSKLPPKLLAVTPDVVSERKAAHRDRMRAIPAAEVVAAAYSAKDHTCYWLISWGWHAEPTQRQEVFDALLEESSPIIAQRLLRAFSRVGLPRYDPALRQWAVRGGEIGRVARRALSRVRDPRVRTLALDRFADPNPDADAILLLLANYAPGDHSLIESALRPDMAENPWHFTTLATLDVFEAHPVPAARASLLTVYEHSPCELCRARAANLLDALGMLPDWIREEATHDVNEELHPLARG